MVRHSEKHLIIILYPSSLSHNNHLYLVELVLDCIVQYWPSIGGQMENGIIAQFFIYWLWKFSLSALRAKETYIYYAAQFPERKSETDNYSAVQYFRYERFISMLLEKI